MIAPRNAVAKSPSENDHTELLKNAEPVDYSGQTVDSMYNAHSINHNDTVGRYQTQPQRGSGRYGARPGPPKGIFDDV